MHHSLKNTINYINGGVKLVNIVTGLLLNLCKYYEQALVIYDGMKRKTGDDYILHPINVAYILATLKMDPLTIAVSLIHEAISLGKMTYEEIEEMFDTDTANIVSSVTQISNLRRTFKLDNPEKYRRIIVGLSENPATLFIKFAERLHNLRTLKVHDPNHQQYIMFVFSLRASLVAQRVKNPSTMQEIQVRSLCREDPLERAWLPRRIP